MNTQPWTRNHEHATTGTMPATPWLRSLRSPCTWSAWGQHMAGMHGQQKARASVSAIVGCGRMAVNPMPLTLPHSPGATRGLPAGVAKGQGTGLRGSRPIPLMFYCPHARDCADGEGKYVDHVAVSRQHPLRHRRGFKRVVLARAFTTKKTNIVNGRQLDSARFPARTMHHVGGQYVW